jgi:hypothetical protein
VQKRQLVRQESFLSGSCGETGVEAVRQGRACINSLRAL